MRQKKLFGGILILVVVGLAVGFFSHSRPVPKLPVKTLDPWILQSNDPDALANRSGMGGTEPYPYGIYLGNGYIGARIGPEGVGKAGPCLMSGLYENEGLKGLPVWSDFPLYDADGKRFELDKTAPYRQTLNMKDGYAETELTLKSGRQKLVGKVTFFIARNRADSGNNVAAIEYRFVPNFYGTVKFRPSDNLSSSSLQLASAIFDERAVQSQPKSWLDVHSGIESRVVKYVAIVHGAGLSESTATDAISAASKEGFDGLLAKNKTAWSELWKSDLIIDGDPKAQQAVHAMMFYLLCSANSGNSIPPTGLSSGAWAGHIFWDADTWMMPALLLQHPDLADGIVNYRLSTIPAAIQNAKKRGLKGLEFAWESAETGKETIGMPTSEERHVTADALLAGNAVGTAQGRSEWYDIQQLLPYRQTADYWVSRAKYNKAKDYYEILNVVPPDENADIVNNSVYTNAAAKRNIELAIAFAKENGQPVPAEWVEVANKMYIPFDKKNDRFVEYEGYKGRETKQADTELLIYPLCYPMTDEVKKNTFNFYKTRVTSKGPAMTSSIHAIIAAELNRPQEAYDHFLESYTDFLRGPFLIFNEKRSKTLDNCCFVTGCGGSIQSVLYGFAGLRIGNQPDGFKELLPDLYIKPCLPPKWKKLELTSIQWRGKAYDLTVSQGNKWVLKPH